jgi:hypothetical protein
MIKLLSLLEVKINSPTKKIGVIKGNPMQSRVTIEIPSNELTKTDFDGEFNHDKITIIFVSSLTDKAEVKELRNYLSSKQIENNVRYNKNTFYLDIPSKYFDIEDGLTEVRINKPFTNTQLAKFLNDNKEEFIKKYLDYIIRGTNYIMEDLEFVVGDNSGDRVKNEYVVYLMTEDGEIGWEGSTTKEYLYLEPDISEEDDIKEITFKGIKFYTLEYDI